MFIVTAAGASLQPTQRRAIVSVVIGAEYQRIWDIMCAANWQAYAARHGYDLIIVTDFLDRSERGLARSPAWQKLLILDQPWAAAYDRIVWIDADIVIADTAPDVAAAAPDPRLVGICASGDQMSEAEKHIYFERLYEMTVDSRAVEKAWAYHEGNRLAADGLPAQGVPMLNTGVMVLSPEHHNALFLEAYARDGQTRLYEQPHLSYELHRRGLIHRITPRFNWIVQEVLVLNFPGLTTGSSEAELGAVVEYMNRELGKAYFLHFAGSMNLMRYMAARKAQAGLAQAAAA